MALRGNESCGNRIAANPVLLKGESLRHEDGGAIRHFEHRGTGIRTGASEPFSLDHNAHDGSAAVGRSCTGRHGGSSPLADRPILVEPFDFHGNPIWKTVRELLGFGRPFLAVLSPRVTDPGDGRRPLSSPRRVPAVPARLSPGQPNRGERQEVRSERR